MHGFSDRWRIDRAARWAAALAVFGLGYAYVFGPAPALDPDSWTFLELARSVFKDFYHTNTLRQYCLQTDYGTTYPPLWPVLMALHQQAFGEWQLSGVLLARLVVMLAIVPCIVLMRMLAGSEQERGRAWYLGLAVWMSLLLNPRFMEEVHDGRSLPLALLFYLCAACVAVRLHREAENRVRLAACLGLLLGLAAFTRADSLILAGMAGLLVWRFYGFRAACFYGGCALLALFPWMAFSWQHFRTPLVSDHQCMVLAAGYPLVLDFHAGDYPTLFNAPLQWAGRMAASGGMALWKFISVTASDMMTVMLLLGVACLRLMRQRVPQLSGRGWGVLSLLLFAMLLPVVLISSFEILRHFSAPVLLVTVCLAVMLGRSQAKDQSVEMMMVLALVMGAAGLVLGLPAGYRLPWNFAPVQLEDYRAQLPCLPKDARVLVGEPKGYNPFEFGYRTQLGTLITPMNWKSLSAGERKLFVARYHVTHVVTAMPGFMPGMLPTRCPKVYTVKP